MSSSQHRAMYAVGTLVVALIGWVGLAPAKSRPSNDGAQQHCGARVRELEAEVLALREQVRDLSEREGNSTAVLGHSTKAPRISANRASKDEHAASCEPPFGFDSSGIKFYRPECVDSPEPTTCEVPYMFTRTGIKTFKPNCLDSKREQTPCESPFSYDSNGIKTYKPECL